VECQDGEASALVHGVERFLQVDEDTEKWRLLQMCELLSELDTRILLALKENSAPPAQPTLALSDCIHRDLVRDVAVTRLVGLQADTRAPHVSADGHGRGSMLLLMQHINTGFCHGVSTMCPSVI